MPKVYLGDSVYMEIEDGMLKLTTDNGLGPSNTIYLEREVFTQLVREARVLWPIKELSHDRD